MVVSNMPQQPIFTMYKIIGLDGNEYGPVSAAQLQQWIQLGRVGPQTQVRVEGGNDWQPLSSFPEFDVPGGAAPPLLSPPSGARDRASSKIAAGVCGILLGSLGVHKFILGYTGAGLIMLLVTVLTCFIASPVMHIVGLIEGILYLTKSDEEFVRTYVDGRKEWF
jgi:TM2 domain-containing membrane protein YozV